MSSIIIIRPNGNIQTDWPNEVGGTRPSIVADDDDDTKVTNGGQSGSFTDWFDCDDLPAAAETINSVTQYSRCWRGTGQNGSCSHGVRVNGGTQEWDVLTQTQALWETKSTVRSLDPDGGAWTVAKVNEIEVGYRQNNGTDTKNFSYADVWFEIDYEAGSGGFAYLVSQWIAPLIGLWTSAALLLREIRNALLLRARYGFGG